MVTLFDTNVWLALTFSAHPFHKSAKQAFMEATASGTVCFCRATQQSFLRLTSTPAILQNYGAQGLTNQDALRVLADLMSVPTVQYLEEAPGVQAVWFRLAALKTASPKAWMDAYLAAFSITHNLTMITLDRDFQQFEKEGLKMLVVKR